MSENIQAQAVPIEFKKYKGIVFGFPEEKNSNFNLNFARFLVIGKESETLIDKGLDNMRVAVRETKDANYFAYIGDLNEVFEFYVSSNTLNTALKKEGLTYQTGEKDSWNSEEDGAEWSKELAALLEYVKNNYFLCTETFLKDGGYYEMYDQFSEKYEARLEDFNELDIEEEVKAVEELKLKIENNFKQ